MTQDQILELLEKLWGNYPNYKGNPQETLEGFERAFGNADAGMVFKAARVHMDLSPFFPNPADIKSLYVKGDMVYGEQPPEAPQLKIVGEVGEEAPCRLESCILYHDLCNGLDENGECPFEGL